jgi:hypothetical protein
LLVLSNKSVGFFGEALRLFDAVSQRFLVLPDPGCLGVRPFGPHNTIPITRGWYLDYACPVRRLRRRAEDSPGSATVQDGTSAVESVLDESNSRNFSFIRN